MDAEIERFLCLCLRARCDPAARAALRAFVADTPLDWNRVSEVAQAERVAPLLHHVLRDEGIVPPAASERLHNAYRFTAHHNLIFLHELGKALQPLNAAGLPVIVLKGGALVEAVYHNIALRPFFDLDLLIRREDLAAVRRALAEIGYRPLRVETSPGAAAAYENEEVLRKPGPLAILIDLHWNLFDSPYYQDTLDLSWFWQSALTTSISGTPAQLLSPTAQLIQLSGHLVLHHSGEDLLWLHDVAEVIACYETQIDWEELLARTQVYNLVVPVQRVLTRVAADWGARIPAIVLERLREMQPSRSEQRVVNWLTAPERPVVLRFWVDLASMGSWRRRCGFAWSNLFPSPAYMRERYRIRHPLLVPLYYPYRWLRGVRSGF